MRKIIPIVEPLIITAFAVFLCVLLWPVRGKGAENLNPVSVNEVPDSISDADYASLSVTGNTLAVGFPRWKNENRFEEGVVFIYERPHGGGQWTLNQTLHRPETSSFARFGSPIVFKGDVAWISCAHAFNTPDGEVPDAVIQYRREDRGQWVPSGVVLQSDDPAYPLGEEFGSVLAAGSTWLAVGVPNRSIPNRWGYGAVEIYDFSTGVREAVLIAETRGERDYFGSVLAADGETLAVRNRSQVEIYIRSPGGQWSRSAVIPALNATIEWQFGSSLALSGKTLLVGAPSVGETPGAVYVFEKRDDGAWLLTKTLKSPNSGVNDGFGARLALSGESAMISSAADGVWLARRDTNGEWIFTDSTAKVPSWRTGNRLSAAAMDSRFLAAGEVLDFYGPLQIRVFEHDAAANLPPAILTAPPLYAERGRRYEYDIKGGDENEGDVVLLSAESLPGWLTFSPRPSGGLLEGTPDEAGEFPVVVTARDSHGGTTRQRFNLKVLPPGGLPVFDDGAESRSIDEGKRVSLSIPLEEVSPATWQWYFNGIALPGETGPELVIESAQLSDAGRYTVKATRAPAVVESPVVELTVNRTADRFGGDWPTFGASASHAGYYPATLGNHLFLPAWSFTVNEENLPLHQTVTGNGVAYVTHSAEFQNTTPRLHALRLRTGTKIWETAFPSKKPNPPSYHRGRIYVQKSQDSNDPPDLRAFDARDGSLLWTSSYDAQWSLYQAPAVTDDGIFISGGTHGGDYRFALDGTRLWFRPMSRFDGWAPLIHRRRFFACYGNTVVEQDPRQGDPFWGLDLQWPWQAGVIAAAEGSTIVVPAPQQGLAAVDVDQRKILWKKEGDLATAAAAIADGIIYAITPGTVRAYGAADGAELGSYPTLSEAGEPQTGIHQPVVLDDHVLVSSLTETWVFDRASRALKQRLPAGGPLTYTDGYLLIAGADGVLHAFAVNQPPALTPPAAPLVWSEDAAAEFRISVSDPEDDEVTVTAENKPAWLTLGGPVNGRIVLSGTPDGRDAGSFSLRLVVSDNKSGESAVDMPFTVLEVNDAPVATRELVEFVIDEDGEIPAVETRALFDDEEDGAAGLTLIAEKPPVERISGFEFNPATGRLLMTPAADFNGAVLVPVRATDSGGLTAETVVSVQIRPVNDAPRLTGLPEGGLAIETDEDVKSAPLDLEPFITDPESAFSALSLKVKEISPAALADAEITAAGELLLTPKPDAFGEGALVVEITDSENLSTELPVKFTMRPVNDAPRASAPAPVAAKEDADPISLQGRTLFSDVDDTLESLTLTLVPAPDGAPFTAALLADGSVRVAFKPDASGAASFTLRAVDAGGLSAEAVYQIDVEPVPDAPTAPAELPSPAVAEDGSPVTMNLAGVFKDVDAGDTLTFTLAGNDRPELFSLAEVDPATGALRLTWAPYVWGTARLTVRATDSAGLFAESSFTVTLPAPPAPQTALKGSLTLNRQTGLLEQTATVTNAGSRAIAGFRLWLDCGGGAELYNGMSGAAHPSTPQPPPADWLVPWERPLAAGETVEIVLELYSPRRFGTVHLHGVEAWNPALEASSATASARVKAAEEGVPFAITRALRLADGVLVEFPSEPRAPYRLEYSADGVNWIACPLTLRAGGTAVQWLDRGPPNTGSNPLSGPRRFYRAVKLQN